MDERWLHNKIRPSSSSLRLSALHIHFFWWRQMLSAGSNKERTKQGKGSELFPRPLLCLIMGEELPPTQSSLVLLSPNGEALLGRRMYFGELCAFLMWLFLSLLLCRHHKVLLFLSSSLFIWASPRPPFCWPAPQIATISNTHTNLCIMWVWRTHANTHSQMGHWSRERDKPGISSTPCFFLHPLIASFISSNTVSVTWSTNRRHCCENGVLMFGAPTCSLLIRALTGHCNGLEQLLEDLRGCNSAKSLKESWASLCNCDSARHQKRV